MALALEIPGPLAGAVIGKGGSTLRRLQSETSTTLQLSQALSDRYLPDGKPNAEFWGSFRTLRVTGPSVAAVQQAYVKIAAVVRAESWRKGLRYDGARLVVPNGAARMLLGADGRILRELARKVAGVKIDLEQRGDKTSGDWLIRCTGTEGQTTEAVCGIAEVTSSRERRRHESFLSNWRFETEYSDHFETPKRAYVDIMPILRACSRRTGGCRRSATNASAAKEDELKRLRVYDPYFCQGRVRRLLEELGCGEGRVINANRDFYADIAAGTVPQHDILVTNPPYSAEHKQQLLDYILDQQRGWVVGTNVRSSGASMEAAAAKEGTGGEEEEEEKATLKPRPFLLLMPAWVAKGDFWRTFLSKLAEVRGSGAHGRGGGGRVSRDKKLPARSPLQDRPGDLEKAAGVFYVCPSACSPYQFDHPQATQRSTCPFFGAWFCGGWVDDAERKAAMAALRATRAGKKGCGTGSGGAGDGGSEVVRVDGGPRRIEVFRSAKMMRKRGHFEGKGSVTKGLATGIGSDSPSASPATSGKRDFDCGIDGFGAEGEKQERKKKKRKEEKKNNNKGKNKRSMG